MDKIDRLKKKAEEIAKTTNLYKNNPYMGMSFDELISMMHISSDPQVPDNGTYEKDQYNVALLEVCRNRRKYAIVCQTGGKGLEETVSIDDPADNNQEPAAEKEVDPMSAYNKLSGSDPEYIPRWIS